MSLEWNQHELDQLLRHFISVSSYYFGLFSKTVLLGLHPLLLAWQKTTSGHTGKGGQ